VSTNYQVDERQNTGQSRGTHTTSPCPRASVMTRLPADRLEAGQECVGVDVRQFLLGGLVPEFDGAVREFEIQIKDQILHVRWRPRRRRLP